MLTGGFDTKAAEAAQQGDYKTAAGFFVAGTAMMFMTLKGELNQITASIQDFLSVAKNIDVVFAWRKSDRNIFFIKNHFSVTERNLVDWSPWIESVSNFSWIVFLGLSLDEVSESKQC